MMTKRNSKFLLIGKGPWFILYFIIWLGIIYDCIANFEELNTKEWIKSILFLCFFLWVICNHLKYGNKESNPKNDNGNSH